MQLKYKVGDIVCTNYGQGEILAVTSQWIIHGDQKFEGMIEYAVSIIDDEILLVQQHNTTK